MDKNNSLIEKCKYYIKDNKIDYQGKFISYIKCGGFKLEFYFGVLKLILTGILECPDDSYSCLSNEILWLNLIERIKITNKNRTFLFNHIFQYFLYICIIRDYNLN